MAKKGKSNLINCIAHTQSGIFKGSQLSQTKVNFPCNLLESVCYMFHSVPNPQQIWVYYSCHQRGWLLNSSCNALKSPQPILVSDKMVVITFRSNGLPKKGYFSAELQIWTLRYFSPRLVQKIGPKNLLRGKCMFSLFSYTKTTEAFCLPLVGPGWCPLILIVSGLPLKETQMGSTTQFPYAVLSALELEFTD